MEVWTTRLPSTVEAIYFDVRQAERAHMHCPKSTGQPAAGVGTADVQEDEPAAELDVQSVDALLEGLRTRADGLRGQFETAFGVTIPLVRLNLTESPNPWELV